MKSDITKQLENMIQRVAPSNANILITGETGVSKEQYARMIHNQSTRSKKPFVVLNCEALRDVLLESELFGHEKSSFTGAYNKKLGLLEIANGGTLVLKNIQGLSPGLQAKLHSFLVTGEVYRMGGKDPIKTDVRVISMTNIDIERFVTHGNFREDLYYRINTIILNVQPLRRRKEEIVDIVNDVFNTHLVFNRKSDITLEVMNALERYDWPGNDRELRNEVERMQILANASLIELKDLSEKIKNPSSRADVDFSPDISLYELEKTYILKALEHYKGNKTQAANALGITIKSLYNKLHEYGEFEKYSVYGK